MIEIGHSQVAKLQQKGLVHANLYGESELGGLNVLYVLDDHPEAFGLPINPKVATAGIGTNWISGIATAGALALVPFYLLFKRKETLAKKVKDVEGKED